MIKSATGLKANIRNISKGNSNIAQSMIRTFFMERFLERLSLSKYKGQFIIKGGMLVSSLIGVNFRTTMDIDTTVKALPLAKDDMVGIVTEICYIETGDNVRFKVMGVDTIMDEFDYPGVRIHLEAVLDNLKQPIKIDISTDDVITPSAIEYDYSLMFDNREIRLNTYNIETLLAEKSQTIINRGLANTRMRDFYDMYEIVEKVDFSWDIYKKAFDATCRKRGTIFSKKSVETELGNLAESKEMEKRWDMFRDRNYFVEDIEYSEIIFSVSNTIVKNFD